MTDITKAVALALWKDGLCLIPTAGGAEKRPFAAWKEYQRRMPTREEVEMWFAKPRPGGIVCGMVSAGLEVIDLDTPEAFAAFRERFGGEVPCEESPHGGHAWYRCDEIGRNARPAAKVDTRGEAGFCVVYQPAVLLGGEVGADAKRPTNSCVPRISPELRASMFEFVRSLGGAAAEGTPAKGARTVRDSLLEGGWRSLGMHGNREDFSRPGAVHAGRCDASLYDGQTLKVWSTAAQTAPAAANTPLAPLTPAAAFVDGTPELGDELWEGLLRAGEVMMVVASPKTGKSLLASQLALACAAGAPVFGRKVSQGRAVLVDLELPPAVLAHRLAAQSAAMGLDLAEIGDALRVSCQRGRVGSLAALAALLDGAAASLVVVDGLYKWLDAEGIDENANAQVAGFMGRLAAMCESMGCALALTHHRRKQTGGKGGVNADEAVGAGAFGRSVDSLHCIVTGKTPGTFEMRSSLRSFPPAAPLVIRRAGPVWKPQ